MRKLKPEVTGLAKITVQGGCREHGQERQAYER